MQHQRWILVVSLCAASHGATYYVATNGSNSAGGTSAAPFGTFAKAFGAMSAGDTLIIKDGTYSERMTGMPSGSSGLYTNIQAEHNFKVIIRTGNALNISGKSFVRVEGIKFDGNCADGDCADIVASDHIKIIRCSFTGSEARSANWNIVTFAITAGCSYVLVQECWAAAGRRVATLVDGPLPQGKHTLTRRADGHPAGIYMVRMEVGSEVQQQHLVFAR